MNMNGVLKSGILAPTLAAVSEGCGITLLAAR